MRRIFQILLLLLPVCCYSQQRIIDSLQRLLPAATTDSARFRLFANIANTYSSTDYDSALYYVDKCLTLAQKNGKKLNEARAMASKGFYLNRLLRLPESYQALTTALQIAEDPRNENSFWNTLKPKVKDKDYRLTQLANIHNSLGIFMQNAGRIDQAIVQYKESIRLYNLSGSSSGVAVITSNLGHLYLQGLNNPDSALLLGQAADSILVQNNEESRLKGSIYAIMGASYLAKHNDSFSLAYLYKAITFGKKYNAQDVLAATYRILAKLYIQNENRDSALSYAQQAANIHIPVYPMDLGDDFENLAKSYALNHQQDSAYKYQSIALATYDSLYQNRIKGLTGFQQLSFDQQQQLQQLEAQKIAAQNRYRIYGLLAGLGIILLVGFFLYRNNQLQRKANQRLQKQKAEIDTKNKELEIEAALERVRSSSLAMHKSDELKKVVKVVFEKLRELGISFDFASIDLYSEGSKDLYSYSCGWTGNEFFISGRYNSYFDHPIMNDIIEAREKGSDFHVKTYTKEEVNSALQYAFAHTELKQQPDSVKAQMLSNEGYTIARAFGKNCAVNINNWSAKQITDSEKSMLIRFATVFEQTYTRFQDLQKAEGQALRAEQDLIEIKAARKRAEDTLQELKAAQAQLIQSEKMASLGDLTAGIAHEIQNPLNFINNFSETNVELIDEAAEELKAGNQQGTLTLLTDIKENERKIHHHGRRADSIVKGMLEHSSTSKGDKQPTNFNALADEYLRLAYHGSRAKDKSFNADIHTHFDESIGKVNIVPQEIGRVLLNLFNNAFYAVNEKKQRLNGTFDPTVTVSTAKQNGRIVLKVADNGTGIPPRVFDKIFQPFFTTKPTGQGTGLGLSLSYDIIKAHGGKVNVETRENEGSTFIISLPIV